MRRFVVSVSLLGAFALAPTLAVAASVTIDGQPVSGAVSKDGHLMVPFRAPLEAIGAKVAWDDATSIASASDATGQLVTVKIGSTEATVRASTKDLSVAPVLENHTAYIPVEMLADISHAQVAYSADRMSAAVTNWDLAGVNDSGATGNTKIFFWLWVWILVVADLVISSPRRPSRAQTSASVGYIGAAIRTDSPKFENRIVIFGASTRTMRPDPSRYTVSG